MNQEPNNLVMQVLIPGADSVTPTGTHGFASFGVHILKILNNLSEKHQITGTFHREKFKIPSGADSVNPSVAYGLTLGADSVTPGADSVTPGADSVTPTGTHSFASFGVHILKTLNNLREKHQITGTFHREKFKIPSGADSVNPSVAHSVTHGADSVNPSVAHSVTHGADSVRLSGADSVRLSGADSVRLSGADSVNPSVALVWRLFGCIV